MHPPGAQVAPGDLIDGRYLVESVLGSGGMAVVHRARHTGTGARCALKLVHPHLVPRRELVDMFLREARVGGRIGKSPYVVDVVDAGFDPARGVPYLVMELLEGETLEERLTRAGPLPPSLVLTLFEQLADALDQAHRAGVVHRDLKPSNLFLTSGRRGQPCLKVMDFGIAKVLEAGSSRAATQIGTPAYAAPEQMGAAMRAAAARQGIVVAPRVSAETDVWALGLIAYELFTGLPPAQFWGAETTVEIPVKAVLFTHDAASARARAGDRAGLLPPGFDAWFARATHPDAAQRWPSAGDAVAELACLVDRMPGVEAPAPPHTPTPAPLHTPTPAALHTPTPAALHTPMHAPAPTPAPGTSYGPGVTEVGAVPDPAPSQLAPFAPLAPIAWAGRTPPPPQAGALPAASGPEASSSAGARWTPRVLPRSAGRFSTSRAIVVVAGSLFALLLLAGGAAIALAPRFVHTARDTCAASGDRCDEACEAGDAASCGRLAARHERGDGVPRDEARAAVLYEKACDAADPSGCAGLGRLHRLGRGGLPRDPGRAVALFKKACDAGGARGCALLGEAYRDGAGPLARDDARAVALFQGACDGGDLVGCKDLGGMHQYGRGGLARNDAEAASHYRHACDGGELLGCNDLGVLLGSGRGGLARDEAQAAVLYQRACDGGEMLGCDNLAWMVEHGKGGLPEDAARAAALYREACDHGDARGCGNLGAMVEHGRGGLPADAARAGELYQRACTGGDAHACDSLGMMIEYGRGGFSRDDARAVALYQKACEAADMRGCKDLGYMHENGRGGLIRDDGRAVALYGRACDGDELQACANLGALLFAGRGGPRDDTRAAALWQRACEGGNETGCANLGWAYLLGRGVLRDRARALELLRRACSGGSSWGCERLQEAEGKAPPNQPKHR